MQRNNENSNPAGKEKDRAVKTEWPRQRIVALARDFLIGGGRMARREIVRTALELDRLLAEA